MHVLGLIVVIYEGDNAPVAPALEGQAGLLPHLPEEAVLGTLLKFKFPAHADPLAVVDVVGLFHPVEHQVLPVLLQVAKGGVAHDTASQ